MLANLVCKWLWEGERPGVSREAKLAPSHASLPHISSSAGCLRQCSSKLLQIKRLGHQHHMRDLAKGIDAFRVRLAGSQHEADTRGRGIGLQSLRELDS